MFDRCVMSYSNSVINGIRSSYRPSENIDLIFEEGPYAMSLADV